MTILAAEARKAVAPSGAVGRLTEYTREVNEIPNTFGRIAQMGIFEARPISTTSALIDQTSNSVGLLPNVSRGGPASVAKGEDVKEVSIVVPHFPHNDYLTPDDLQDRRAPGTTGPDTQTRQIVNKLERIRQMHAQTLEHLMMGAIKGIVTTGNGNVVYNGFTEFGITEEVIDWKFGTPTQSIMAHCKELSRYMEGAALTGSIIDGIHVLCSPGWFDGLTQHANVEAAYNQFQTMDQIAVASSGRTPGQAAGLQPLRAQMRRGFSFGNILFEEYDATVTKPDGSTEKFIPDDEARAFLPNVPGLFRTYFSPANKMQHVNTEGQELYVFTYEDPEGNGIKLESQSNPLPICVKPATLVKLTLT